MAGTIIGETKREGQIKDKRHTTCKNQKKGRELVPLVVGSYFTHGPSIVSHMQIMKSHSNVKSCTCQILFISTIFELSFLLLLCVGFVYLWNIVLNFFHLFFNSLWFGCCVRFPINIILMLNYIASLSPCCFFIH